MIAVITVFTEWTCEGSLKLSIQEYTLTGFSPVTKEMCMSVHKRAVDIIGNLGGTAEVDYKAFVPFNKKGAEAFFACRN